MKSNTPRVLTTCGHVGEDGRGVGRAALGLTGAEDKVGIAILLGSDQKTAVRRNKLSIGSSDASCT
ncbi:hypothetical protein [Streptomyces sp. NPDC050534]|uniref:hypothetical protein n=1 Tax=Streptomyces sp. NPDC050534 TaxID=3365625 RepID=UPI0037BC7F63